jgi:hypothetical protein
MKKAAAAPKATKKAMKVGAQRIDIQASEANETLKASEAREVRETDEGLASEAGEAVEARTNTKEDMTRK